MSLVLVRLHISLYITCLRQSNAIKCLWLWLWNAVVTQVHELETQQAAVNAELKAIRTAVADDNEEFVVKGVKGVSAAQELISMLFLTALK